jgi:Dockerin type I domain
VAEVFGGSPGYFFGYDEMRQMNSTASAKAMNMTPAQLLDWHFNQTYRLYRSTNPSSTIYVWSDMFDPNHNAVNNYYLVEGDLTGSWTGLPADVVMMNWNLGQLKTSATWFATPPYAHRQIVAGYYDSGNGSSAAAGELSQVAGITGILGLMYTTYANDYSQLANFASAARAGWKSYTASLPASSPSVTSFSVLYGSKSYNLIGPERSGLPWQIAGIQVTFSEPITSGNASSLAGVAATSFTGLGTNTLTWNFNPISQGSLTAFLQGSGPNALTDAAGHGLGNGGGFTQALKTLWGDFNGDGVVNMRDLDGVTNLAHLRRYNIYADLNGDGKVDGSDSAIVRSHLGATQQ